MSGSKRDTAEQQYSVVIADDHHLVVQSLRHLVDATQNLDCVAAVHDGLSCIDSASALKPDLILLDLDLPGIGGEELIELLSQVSVDSRILVITANTIPRVIKKVWHSGVFGLVLKGSPVHEICEAISVVLSGQRYAAVDVARILSTECTAEVQLESLTGREREVFELLLRRLSVNSISTRLNVSPKTIDNHKTRIMAKLDVHSRADLMAFAIRAGFQDLILEDSDD